MKKTILKKINILSLISIIISAILIININNINIVPTKYFIIGVGTILLLNIVGIILLNLKKKVSKVLAIIILSIITIISGIGIFYLNITNNFLNNSFNNKIINKTTYYIVTSKSNNYKENNIKGNIAYYQDTANINKALSELKKTYKIEGLDYSNIEKMYQDVLSKKTKFMLVEKASYGIVFDLNKDLNKKDYEIIYKYSIETSKKNKNATKDSYNIYVGGTDFTNSLMDFNMLVSINTKTNEVLLTSIPRDYYIEVAGQNGKKDTLSYMGPYGIETSVASLESLFNTNIDYYVKINTESLVGIVDKVGGITYCSDISYTTTHALVLNTYNDKGKKLKVQKGCQQLNGIETLTVARERNAFPGRDRVRQENCRKIILAILDKLKSTNTIVNYNEILSSLSSLYETTIPKEVISNLAKKTIDGDKWTIKEQSLDGTDGQDYVHLTNLKDWVMYPSEDSVNSAKEQIKNLIQK